MLIRSNDLYLHVASLHTGQVVDSVERVIINPNDLSIVGFYLEKHQGQILLSREIREVAKNRAIIDSEDTFADPEDLLRLQDILNIDYQLIGKKAQTKSEEKLGSVEDYIVDDISWKIQKLHIKRSVFKSLSTGKLIIDRRQIIEVSDSAVIVEDAVLRAGKLAPQQVS